MAAQLLVIAGFALGAVVDHALLELLEQVEGAAADNYILAEGHEDDVRQAVGRIDDLAHEHIFYFVSVFHLVALSKCRSLGDFSDGRGR